MGLQIKVKMTYTCRMCGRKVQYNKPHKCPARKPK